MSDTRTILMGSIAALFGAADWLRPFVAVLALIAILVRAVVAPGYMPDARPTSGAFTIIMCSGQAALHAVKLSLPIGPIHDHGDHGKDCAYASAALPLIGAEPPQIIGPSPLAPTDRRLTPPASPEHIHAPWRPNAPPTGPPRLA